VKTIPTDRSGQVSFAKKVSAGDGNGRFGAARVPLHRLCFFISLAAKSSARAVKVSPKPPNPIVELPGSVSESFKSLPKESAATLRFLP